MNLKPLTDTDLMTFGKHRGKQMQDVPVSYLHWMWKDVSHGAAEHTDRVRDYIKENLHALAVENKDLIW